MATVTINVMQNNNQYSSAYKKFYGRVQHGETISSKTLCAHAAKDSGIEESSISLVFDAFLKQFEEQLCGGHPIKVDNLGTFKVGIHSSGIGVNDVKKSHPEFDPEKDDIQKYVSAKQVKSAHLLFTPCEEIKELLRAVKFETDKSHWEQATKDEEEEDIP